MVGVPFSVPGDKLWKWWCLFCELWFNRQSCSCSGPQITISDQWPAGDTVSAAVFRVDWVSLSMWLAVVCLSGESWLLDPSLFSLPTSPSSSPAAPSVLQILANGTSIHCLGQNWQLSLTPLPASTLISNKHQESSTLLAKSLSNSVSPATDFVQAAFITLSPQPPASWSSSSSPLLNSFCCCWWLF